ncbi:MAG: hypothetical protein O9301_08710 [Leptospira sp.]|nr:hypothetical protein [Leptospira sp.]
MKIIYNLTSAFFILSISVFLLYSDQTDKKSHRKFYRMEEVIQHNSAQSCWIIIDNQVFDVTDYNKDHPTRLDVILKWCGKESSNAYNTKDRKNGRPHSKFAKQILPEFYIGDLQN